MYNPGSAPNVRAKSEKNEMSIFPNGIAREMYKIAVSFLMCFYGKPAKGKVEEKHT